MIYSISPRLKWQLTHIEVVTLGFELVTSLQLQFQPNVAWLGSAFLPQMLGTKSGSCEIKSIGRGSTFHLTPSLFDYTVISVWNTTKAANSTSQIPEQEHIEYRGESFAHCRVRTIRFDHSIVEEIQVVTASGSMDIDKDFVGRYYRSGPDEYSGRDLLPELDRGNYRELAYAVLETISTDSLSTTHQHLSAPVLSITMLSRITFVDGKIETTPLLQTLTYFNGTQVKWTEETFIYAASILNLMNVAAHTVNLDLGSAGPESIYLNSSALNVTIDANLAPPGILLADWAQNSVSFYYGQINLPYETWAQMLHAGQKIKLAQANSLVFDVYIRGYHDHAHLVLRQRWKSNVWIALVRHVGQNASENVLATTAIASCTSMVGIPPPPVVVPIASLKFSYQKTTISNTGPWAWANSVPLPGSICGP
ncbi:hypothetical protein BDV93DRAFT_512915 [Ceratobasidium sp. AG-I]|nr:hypothetical protein BDV93DRAFT_512915 [Ceratobasidium sp. AG-I]